MDPGPDGIPAHFLKLCSPTLAFPVSCLFNLSLSSASFPAHWKSACIIPLYKSGDRSQVSNYRPISILPALGKMLESFVTDHLFGSLKQSVIPEQHGFFPGRSTQTNLLVYHQYLTKAVESGFQVDSIYTDFQKAFDRVSHSILLNKLESLGVDAPLLLWLYSYLDNRNQCVRIKNCTSRPIQVTSGVPQGSHLGPLLFTVFINDIGAELVNSKFLLFADDLKLFSVVRDAADQRGLQSDLRTLEAWCVRNSMTLNTDKCHIITFTKSPHAMYFQYALNGKSLTRVDSIRDLGVVFHQSLNFNLHIESIVCRAYRMAGFIRRQCAEFNSVAPLIHLFQSLVRPVLEYCSVIWSPFYEVHIKRLEDVQRKFVNFLLFKLNIDKELYSYTDRLQLLGMVSLEARRRFDSVKCGYRIINGHVDCSELISYFAFRVPTFNSRCKDLFSVEYHRTNYGMHGPVISMCRAINSLPVECDLFKCSIAQLRRFVL